jgi:hypothetical protein
MSRGRPQHPASEASRGRAAAIDALPLLAVPTVCASFSMAASICWAMPAARFISAGSRSSSWPGSPSLRATSGYRPIPGHWGARLEALGQFLKSLWTSSPPNARSQCLSHPLISPGGAQRSEPRANSALLASLAVGAGARPAIPLADPHTAVGFAPTGLLQTEKKIVLMTDQQQLSRSSAKLMTRSEGGFILKESEIQRGPISSARRLEARPHRNQRRRCRLNAQLTAPQRR